MFLVLINSFYSASLIGYSHSNHSTIRISHSYYDGGKMRRFNKNTFTVKSLTFLHLLYFFNCIFHILYSFTRFFSRLTNLSKLIGFGLSKRLLFCMTNQSVNINIQHFCYPRQCV